MIHNKLWEHAGDYWKTPENIKPQKLWDYPGDYEGIQKIIGTNRILWEM